MRKEIQVRFLGGFDRDYARCRRDGLPAEDFEHVLEFFLAGEPLPAWYNDHPLEGELSAYREFHLGEGDDLVVVYRWRGAEAVFAKMGRHKEAFGHRKWKKKGGATAAPESFPDQEAEGGMGG